MLKSTAVLFLAGLGWAVPATAAVLGPDAGLCRGAGPAALVRVEGFKQRTGKLRVQVYDSADNFLSKGRYLKRIDLPVTAGGAMDVCVGVPHAGTYAFAVRHDVTGSGKSDWSDGGGFSRNPHLSLFDLKPRFSEVAVPVGAPARPIAVTLNYRQGLSIAPVADAR